MNSEQLFVILYFLILNSQFLIQLLLLSFILRFDAQRCMRHGAKSFSRN